MIQPTLTLKATTTQVVETSFTVSSSPVQDYTYPEDHAPPTYTIKRAQDSGRQFYTNHPYFINSSLELVPFSSQRCGNCLLKHSNRLNLSVKKGTPSDEDLEELSQQIGKSWKPLGRRLQFTEAEITTFHKENPDECSEKAYQMLLRWKSRDGKDATYQVLYDALDHKLVKEKRLAEEICCDWHGTACMWMLGLIETRSEHLGQNASIEIHRML